MNFASCPSHLVLAMGGVSVLRDRVVVVGCCDGPVLGNVPCCCSCSCLGVLFFWCIGLGLHFLFVLHCRGHHIFGISCRSLPPSLPPSAPLFFTHLIGIILVIIVLWVQVILATEVMEWGARRKKGAVQTSRNDQ